MSDKPVFHVFVGYLCPPYGLIGQTKVMPLDEAVEYAALGFTVIRDPFAASDLARWEQLQRVYAKPRRSWLD